MKLSEVYDNQKKNLFISPEIMTKITGAKCRMMTKKWTKLRKIHRKMTEICSGQTDGRTDRQTDRQ